jgi:hypothetical protein
LLCGAGKRMAGDHPRNTYRSDAVEPALRGENALGQALHVSGGSRKKTLSDAWRGAGVGRSTRQQKRAEVWAVYARRHRGTPATARAATTITHVDSKDRVIGRTTGVPRWSAQALTDLSNAHRCRRHFPQRRCHRTEHAVEPLGEPAVSGLRCAGPAPQQARLAAARNSHGLASCSRAMLRTLRYSSLARISRPSGSAAPRRRSR